MRFYGLRTTGLCLPPAKLGQGNTSDAAFMRAIVTLPLRDRCLLRLFLNRGASQAELAGILGMSRQRVAKMLQRLISTAADPRRLALVSAWHRLSPQEQRLAYLHVILEVPLPRIARMGLLRRTEADGRPGPIVSRTTLTRLMRRIQRKAQRGAAARNRRAARTPTTPPDR